MREPDIEDELGGSVYSLICKREGITARDIARELGRGKAEVNRCLYSYPFISDLGDFGVDCGAWEVVYELRIRRARWVRIYADVMVIAGRHSFALEFKMKDEGSNDELAQAAKYVPYIEVVLGREVDVTPALVLTRADGVYMHGEARDGRRVLVASPDMLFNVFDEKLRFLG